MKYSGWDLPGGPVVKTPCFHCRGIGSVPGQGTKILHAMWPAHTQETKGEMTYKWVQVRVVATFSEGGCINVYLWLH